MLQDNSVLWVYDTELDELYTDGIGRQSLVEGVIGKKLNGSQFVIDDLQELIENNQDRFVFFTKSDIEQAVINAALVRNPIIDNVNFQKKYEFDKNPLTKDKLRFRMDLLAEEYEETLSAFNAEDSEEFVDGLTDLVVIALGTLSLSGVSVNKAWSEVYRANMSKVRGIKPGREQSGGFDVIKPEGWKGPDHSNNHGDLPQIFAQE